MLLYKLCRQKIRVSVSDGEVFYKWGPLCSSNNNDSMQIFLLTSHLCKGNNGTFGKKLDLWRPNGHRIFPGVPLVRSNPSLSAEIAHRPRSLEEIPLLHEVTCAKTGGMYVDSKLQGLNLLMMHHLRLGHTLTPGVKASNL